MAATVVVVASLSLSAAAAPSDPALTAAASASGALAVPPGPPRSLAPPTYDPEPPVAEPVVVEPMPAADKRDRKPARQAKPEPKKAVKEQSETRTQWWESAVSDGPSPTGELGIPERVLQAYRAAARQSHCPVHWSVLAGIGQIESQHASGGRVLASGRTFEPILGPVLNGGGFASISDSDDGRLDGHRKWDRAVGPMQFLPGTWAWMGKDADGDGKADPHDIDDAAAAAANYLCRSGSDLSKKKHLAAALLTYNRSSSYVAAVMDWAEGYAERAAAIEGVQPPADDSDGPKPGKKSDKDSGKGDGKGRAPGEKGKPTDKPGTKASTDRKKPSAPDDAPGDGGTDGGEPEPTPTPDASPGPDEPGTPDGGATPSPATPSPATPSPATPSPATPSPTSSPTAKSSSKGPGNSPSATPSTAGSSPSTTPGEQFTEQ